MCLQLFAEVFHTYFAIDAVVIDFEELCDQWVIQKLMTAYEAAKKAGEPSLSPLKRL